MQYLCLGVYNCISRTMSQLDWCSWVLEEQLCYGSSSRGEKDREVPDKINFEVAQRGKTIVDGL